MQLLYSIVLFTSLLNIFPLMVNAEISPKYVNGDVRYVEQGSEGTIKLYLNETARDKREPTHGMNNENTEKNSCGADALYNLLKWWNIKHFSNGNLVTVKELMKRLRVDEWATIKVLGQRITADFGTGTTSPLMRRRISEIAKHEGLEYDYQHGKGDIERILKQLRKGNPVLIKQRVGRKKITVYKMGKGHFALIMGIEFKNGKTYVHIANGRNYEGAGVTRMVWENFRKLWRADYKFVMGITIHLKKVLNAIHEYMYAMWYLNDDNPRNDLVKIIHSTNGGPWGKWSDMEMCPKGTYAYGYSMRVEKMLGDNGDDTALNAIRLFCGKKVGDSIKYRSKILSNDSHWGKWHTAITSDQSFFNQFSIKVEAKQDRGDDTAVNGVKFKTPATTLKLQIPSLPSPANPELPPSSSHSVPITFQPEFTAKGEAPWGEWGNYSECPINTVICGVRGKYESKRGNGDDTALNDLDFACCSVQPTQNDKVCLYQHSNYGGWKKCFNWDEPDFVKLDINDAVSSLIVRPDWVARLYKHTNYRGPSVDYTGDTSWVGRKVNDRFSSLKIAPQ